MRAWVYVNEYVIGHCLSSRCRVQTSTSARRTRRRVTRRLTASTPAAATGVNATRGTRAVASSVKVRYTSLRHYVTTSLRHYITTSLRHYVTTSLVRLLACTTMSQYHNAAISLAYVSHPMTSTYVIIPVCHQLVFVYQFAVNYLCFWLMSMHH